MPATVILGQESICTVHSSQGDSLWVALKKIFNKKRKGHIVTGDCNQNLALPKTRTVMEEVLTANDLRFYISKDGIESIKLVVKMREICALYNPQLSKGGIVDISAKDFTGILLDNPGGSEQGGLPPISKDVTDHLQMLQAERESLLKDIDQKKAEGYEITSQLLVKLCSQTKPDGTPKFPNTICYHNFDQSFGDDHAPTYHVADKTIYFEINSRLYTDINYKDHFKDSLETPEMRKVYEEKFNELSTFAYREYFLFLKQMEGYPPHATDVMAQSVIASLREPPPNENMKLTKYDLRSYVGRILFSQEFQPFLKKELLDDTEADKEFLQETFLDNFFKSQGMTLDALSELPLDNAFDWIFNRLEHLVNEHLEQEANKEEKEEKPNQLPNIIKFKEFLHAIYKKGAPVDASLFLDTQDPYAERLLRETYQLSQTYRGVSKISGEDLEAFKRMTPKQIKEYVDDSINNKKQKMGYDATENDIKNFIRNILNSEQYEWINSRLQTPEPFGGIVDANGHRNFDKIIEQIVSFEAMSKHFRRRPEKLLFSIFQNLDPNNPPLDGQNTLSIDWGGFQAFFDKDGRPLSRDEVREAQVKHIINFIENVRKNYPDKEVVLTLVEANKQDEKIRQINEYIEKVNVKIRMEIAQKGEEINYLTPQIIELQQAEQLLAASGDTSRELLQIRQLLKEYIEKCKQDRLNTTTPNVVPRASSRLEEKFHLGAVEEKVKPEVAEMPKSISNPSGGTLKKGFFHKIHNPFTKKTPEATVAPTSASNPAKSIGKTKVFRDLFHKKKSEQSSDDSTEKDKQP